MTRCWAGTTKQAFLLPETCLFTSHTAGSYSGSLLVRDECSCQEYAPGSLLCHTWLSAQWVSLHWLAVTQLLANTRAPFKNKYSYTEENKGSTQSLCAPLSGQAARPATARNLMLPSFLQSGSLDQPS